MRLIFPIASVAFALLFATLPMNADDASSGASMTLTQDGTTAQYDVALDKVVIRSSGRPTIETVPAQKNLASMLEFVEQLLTVGKLDASLVLYPAGSRKPSEARVLTNEVLVKATPDAVAKISKMDGVYSVKPLKGLPNYYRVNVLKPGTSPEMAKRLKSVGGVESSEIQLSRRFAPRLVPNDPLFPDQWNFLSNGQSGVGSGSDINITPAWDTATGTGIVVGVIDEGVDFTNPDLTANESSANNYDFVDDDTNPAPFPGYSHGTSCAGLAGAVTNNNLGVAGAAFGATLAGLKIDFSFVTDATTAEALSYNNDAIFVKSNSWGPIDDGQLAPAGAANLAALQNGATSGRGGLGVIYPWAAGNGLQNNDNSNYDGFTNSIYTLAVTATDENGQQAFYAEPGSNISVAAPGSSFVGITTTTNTGEGDVSSNYTNQFNGTSAATPQVAGVVALMLQTKPTLGWRDVQEILMKTAQLNDPTEAGWTTNAAGFHFNEKYGAGLVDATAAVTTASTWTNLATQETQLTPVAGTPQVIPDNVESGVNFFASVSSSINRVEHVQLRFTAAHTWRGDLQITLTSPSGTVSTLQTTHGDSTNDIDDWPFMTVRNWGENPNGQWRVNVSDRVGADEGTVVSMNLVIYGTTASAALPPSTDPAPGPGSTALPAGLGDYPNGTGGDEQPVITMRAPENRTLTTTLRSYPISGTVADSGPVSGVYWKSPRSNGWQAASGTNDWWSYAELRTGDNEFQVQAIDTSGFFSKIMTFKIKRED